MLKRISFELFFWLLSPLPFLYYALRALRTGRWASILTKVLLLRQSAFDRVFNKFKY